MLVGPLLGMALTGYFAYHLVEGDRGLRAWVRLTQELRHAKENLAAVSAERAELEHRVSHMRPDHVDPDLLDAQVRKTLDLVAAGRDRHHGPGRPPLSRDPTRLSSHRDSRPRQPAFREPRNWRR